MTIDGFLDVLNPQDERIASTRRLTQGRPQHTGEETRIQVGLPDTHERRTRKSRRLQSILASAALNR